ncbi:spore coat protein [Hazenella sp. IB182357]|uniref:Spore coat protein n=2 Tax=Polycladospora coralii TaxID=2771432 RepID=A0A926N7Z2_9BACL|nr:spore coat protein [Polycladospora coralii]MBD1370872.1 spore coat protein [Polycladospora coralii]MBS7529811.1 spore coat protein [Polycladospora coralii]
MSDRDRLTDILSLEKYLANGYNIATQEASNETLYQSQFQILSSVHQTQRDLFNLMQQKGWYQIEPVEEQKITDKANQFTQDQAQFPYA